VTNTILRPLLLAVALSVLVVPTASAAETPYQALAQLAAQQTHGWADRDLSYKQLEAKLDSGERIYVPCGIVAILGLRLMHRMGAPTRLVGTFANERGDLYDVPDDTLESHAMLEVWENGRWQLYDLDGNVKAVDQDGRGVGIEQFAEGPRYYDRLTDESGLEVYNAQNSPYRNYEEWLFANPETWYDRVLGTVSILPPGGQVYYFNDPTLKSILGPMAGYEWVDAQQWDHVVDAPPETPKPPVSVSPPPILPPATPVPQPNATRKACEVGGRSIRRRKMSCSRARRVLGRYLRTRKAPAGWRCSDNRRVRCASARSTALTAIKPPRF
jgi:hypothetical protein